MNIKYLDSICVDVNIERIETTRPVVVTIDNNNGSDRSLTRQELDSNVSMQQIRLLRVTIVVDTLDQHQ